MSRAQKERLTHEEVAEGFWSMVPDYIPRTTLEEYGVEITEQGLEIVTRELLSLNLFYMSLALHHFDRGNGERVFNGLCLRVREFLARQFAYSSGRVDQYLDEMERCCAEYSLAISAQDNPVAPFTYFAVRLLQQNAIRLQDSDKAVEMALRLVPMAEFIEATEEIELVEA